MALDFTETLLLEIPNVEKQLAEFAESAFKESHGLVIEIAAIHAGLTANFNQYGEKSLEGSLLSWTTPYEKPIILNHDLYTEPLGRIIGARMAKEADGTPYVKLQAAITDPMAIQKVSDRRYLTGSVGGKAKEALCSVCGTDWANPKEGAGMPCRHQRGKIYSGKLAFMDMKDVQFHEYSFVNVPADKRSTVVSLAAQESEISQNENWSQSPRFFILDMDSENVYEYTESEQPRDVLAEMKKKDATPLYLGMKGAYLAALAIEETDGEDLEKDGVKAHITHTNSKDDNDISHEENVMAKENNVKDEDILAVTEELSGDLSQLSDKKSNEAMTDGDDSGSADLSPEPGEVKVHDFIDKNKDGNCDVCGATAAQHADAKLSPGGSDESEAMTDGDDSGNADLSPEPGDVKNHDFIDKNKDGFCDVCGGTEAQHKDASISSPGSDEADLDANSTKEEDGEHPEGQEYSGKDVEPETSDGAPLNRESDEDEANKEVIEEESLETELSEETENAEPLVEELTSKVAKLEEENDRLRKALHRTLVERVVDAKITAGVVEQEDRATAIQEHGGRTASSLADTLKDLAKMPRINSSAVLNLGMDEKSEIVGEEEHVITIGEEDDTDKPDPTKVAEDTLVDALMGRMSLQF